MIGHFKDVADAERVEDVLNRLEVLVNDEVSAKRMEVDGSTRRFSRPMLDALTELKIYDLGPVELEQFAYDVRVKREGADVVITTDESDVSAFLKVLIDNKARVEVYSAHFYADEKYGRGK
jgi:hypothetical protein